MGSYHNGLCNGITKNRLGMIQFGYRLTKSAHFLPVKTTYGAAHLAKLYIKRIVCLHGMPVSILSGKGPQFTSEFWHKLQEELGVRLDFSITFHLQIDG